MKFESKNIKNDSYCDAWELRRLYTFAFRRQNDAAKRSQRPRDRWEMGMGGGIVQTGACVKPHGSPQSIYLYINNMCIYFRNPGLLSWADWKIQHPYRCSTCIPLVDILPHYSPHPWASTSLLAGQACEDPVQHDCSAAQRVGMERWQWGSPCGFWPRGQRSNACWWWYILWGWWWWWHKSLWNAPEKNSAEGGWLVRWPVRWVWKPSQFEVERNGDSCWDDHGRRVGTSEGLAGHRWFGGSAYINKVITLEWACNQWFFIVSLYILKTKFPKSKSIGGLRGFYRCFLQYMLEYDDGEMGTRKLLLFSGHHRLIGSRHPSHGLKARDNRYPFPEIS